MIENILNANCLEWVKYSEHECGTQKGWALFKAHRG